jgi:Cysteine rich repeat
MTPSKENAMSNRIASAIAAGLLLAGTTPLMAQQSLTEQVITGCKNELESYCSQVTQGEGRLLACLYAYGDKLSGQCEFALYDAAARLERAISAITYVASECRSELEAHCANVQPGEGRIAQCLVDHASQLSPGCDQALTNAGVK